MVGLAGDLVAVDVVADGCGGFVDEDVPSQDANAELARTAAVSSTDRRDGRGPPRLGGARHTAMAPSIEEPSPTGTRLPPLPQAGHSAEGLSSSSVFGLYVRMPDSCRYV